MADTMLHEVTDGLATITLNRPDAMNSLNTEIKEALREALQQAAADSAVRAVLLTGRGRAFCVGQDLKEHIGTLAEARESGGGNSMDTVRRHYNPITEAIAGMPKPVVAAVNGVAAGAGAGFAFAADYRIAAATATFTTSFAGVALTADSGVSWTLPRLIGHGRAADLLLFPRTVDAHEALDLGMVNRVVPADELAAEAEAVARKLAGGPTLAYAALKESMAYGTTHTLVETLAKEDELQTRAGASEDHAIAVEAFVRKEKPRFTGR
ncbi:MULTISPECIES: enoyl-CoA hydratase-related protein [Streptomyces]|uniref:Enoyl-CoA hydratase n=2 Tax=Streptomyces TaxID=1883 RepID=A0A3M8FC12_9ACTN|nr:MULTISPECIES: enoyl-CoA hydratase-related protein [Streptomyces]KNE78987.1 enoyl-CoA hydratase [Streptomyces fradiae]OFA34032.1 enoyl-CoA hydratase [Streptomyces fradiae]PQM24142.1 enoyl-CoA hydratase [Streptomyces xinghaiensis]RKM97107.1 enoyl-CoA hydratase [Streptomyces xinghaiensis]RNC75500.1 enoyl-CoA hydratase [Streptomyces xinghaiensis]